MFLLGWVCLPERVTQKVGLADCLEPIPQITKSNMPTVTTCDCDSRFNPPGSDRRPLGLLSLPHATHYALLNTAPVCHHCGEWPSANSPIFHSIILSARLHPQWSTNGEECAGCLVCGLGQSPVWCVCSLRLIYRTKCG